jgi:ABC-type antimicrobial peptide transport system permease subunit
LKRKAIRNIALLAAVCGVAGIGIWWKLHKTTSAPGISEASVKVERRDLSSTVLATGAVKPQVGAEVRVGARISGRVEKLQSNIGDKVDKGQVLAVLAGLSLLVGGIVLMNILLISVGERKKEIGLRRALGATQGDIFRQFLFESLTVTIIGMIAGCLLGWAGSVAMARLTQASAD